MLHTNPPHPVTDSTEDADATRTGVSLILMDRTLDLVAPLAGADSTANDILDLLPCTREEPGSHVLAPVRALDVCVDMAPVLDGEDGVWWVFVERRGLCVVDFSMSVVHAHRL